MFSLYYLFLITVRMSNQYTLGLSLYDTVVLCMNVGMFHVGFVLNN